MTKSLNCVQTTTVDMTQPVPQKSFSSCAIIDCTTATPKALVNSTEDSFSDELNKGITNFIGNGSSSVYVAGAIYDGADFSNIEAIIEDFIDVDDVYAFTFILPKEQQATAMTEIADIMLAEKRMCITELNGDATAVLAIISSLNTERMAFFCRKEDEFSGSACALAGYGLPFTPGTMTYSNKQLTNVTLSSYTRLELQQILDGNGIVFVNDRGYLINRLSNTADGSYIDITTTKDYVEYLANINLTALMTNSLKIAYTDKDMSKLKATLDSLGEQLKGLNIISSYVTTVPSAASVPQADKSNRILNGLVFEYTLSGSIETIALQLTVKI